MSKLKFYTTMVLCLCTVAIGSTVEFYGNLNTTEKTVEQAHTAVFKDFGNESQREYTFNSLKALVYDK